MQWCIRITTVSSFCKSKIESSKSWCKHYKKGNKNTKRELSAKTLINCSTALFTCLAKIYDPFEDDCLS